MIKVLKAYSSTYNRSNRIRFIWKWHRWSLEATWTPPAGQRRNNIWRFCDDFTVWLMSPLTFVPLLNKYPISLRHEVNQIENIISS